MSSITAQTLKGTYTALITPFSASSEELDLDSLASLLDYQFAAGVNGFVACGSTAEAATLSDDEYVKVLSFVKQQNKGRVPLVAGIGTNNTLKARAQAKLIEELGYDAILLVTPPYNKPSQEGIIAHFKAVKSSANLPIIAYNIPGRSVVNITPKTIAEMCRSGLIVGLKDSTASLDQLMDVLAACGGKLSVVSGEDSLVLAMMACGAKGVISASANIAVREFVQLTTAALKADWEKAKAAQFEVLAWVRLLFTETNPVPVKAALQIKGVIKHATPRLPLLPAKEETLASIRALLKSSK